MYIQNKSEELVSIIVPMFNAEKYIAQTIESVLNQIYFNWEMIIIDDCSTDRSRDVVKEYIAKDERIRLIESIENFGGPARPRNIGVKNANGEYLAFLDSDDLWSSNKLQIQINFMKKFDANFTSTDALDIDENSKRISKKGKIKQLIADIKREKIKKRLRPYSLKGIDVLIENNFIYLSSVVLHKSIFQNFSESKELRGVEDYFLWLNLFENPKTHYIKLNDTLLFYRQLSNSLSHSNSNQHKLATINCKIQFIVANNRFDLLGHICSKK